MKKARVITFKVEDRMIAADKPYFKMLEHKGLPKAISSEDMDITTMPLTDYTERVFDLIALRDGRKTENYFVNFEEASHVMPILKGIVNTKTEKSEVKNQELELRNAELTDIIKKIEGYWFNRIWRWINDKN